MREVKLRLEMKVRRASEIRKAWREMSLMLSGNEGKVGGGGESKWSVR